MDSEIAKFSVKGLCAAPFTCMSDDGTVDLSGIAAQVAELKRGGVKYAFSECQGSYLLNTLQLNSLRNNRRITIIDDCRT